MATQNGKSCEHITNFFLNLMCFLTNQNTAEVRLIKVLIVSPNVLSYSAMKSVHH